MRYRRYCILCCNAIISALGVCCGSKTVIEDGRNDRLDVEDPRYAIVRENENLRVEQLLQLYEKGILNDGTDEVSYNNLNIAFMTDSHIDLGPIPLESKRNVRDAISFCNMSKVPIYAIIHGGDLITDIKSTKKEHIKQLETFFDLGWNAKMPLLFTKGNHDINAIRVNPSQVMSDKDWSDVWFDKAEKEYGIKRNINANGQKTGYYYYDLDEWKVRIISLDCFDVDYTQTDEEGNVLYWAGTSFYFANEQLNWLVNSALNFDNKEEKDWGVILFTHFYYPYNVPDHTYGTTVEPVFDDIYRRMNSLLVAFNRQSSYSISYSFPQNSFYDLSVTGDWTRYAEQEQKPYLICVLSGHQHTDLYTNYWGGIHIVTANQFCGTDYSDERILRLPGTRSQNLFDILNIDLKKRKLRVIRYGASANLDGQEGNRFLPDGHGF